MAFLRTWLGGYLRPTHVGERLKERPAPHWGLYAQLTRALLDSLLLYAPLAVLGRVPSTPSWLNFLPARRYYGLAVHRTSSDGCDSPHAAPNWPSSAPQPWQHFVSMRLVAVTHAETAS